MEVRLNSLRGKFKITNTADDQVDLTPEDIPGASFIQEAIEKLTVAQLKFFSLFFNKASTIVRHVSYFKFAASAIEPHFHATSGFFWNRSFVTFEQIGSNVPPENA